MEKLRDFLRVREAAAILGVSPNTLRNWSRDGKIPFHRNPINGYRLYKRTDLERLLRTINEPSRRGGAAGRS